MIQARDAMCGTDMYAAPFQEIEAMDTELEENRRTVAPSIVPHARYAMSGADIGEFPSYYGFAMQCPYWYAKSSTGKPADARDMPCPILPIAYAVQTAMCGTELAYAHAVCSTARCTEGMRSRSATALKLAFIETASELANDIEVPVGSRV
eukprot:3773346-Rhodomonas_salina.6